MKEKEYLFQVSIKHKQTKETIKLFVWAKNVDEATHNLYETLIGYNCEYEWCGSSPVYENNNNVMREITTFKELREASGMSRPEFAEYFGIPYRTVQSWELGDRRCPEYLLKLMEYKIYH